MATYSSGTTWYVWCSDGTSTTDANLPPQAYSTWGQWCSSTTSNTISDSTSTGDNWGRWVVVQEETVEQRAARESREEQRRIEAEAREQERQEAEQKAEALLRSQLNPEQQRQLDEMSAFIINNGMRTYKIGRGRSRNIKELDEDGNVIATLCAHPREQVPDADTMLVQKIMLEHAEQEFLQTANRTVH